MSHIKLIARCIGTVQNADENQGILSYKVLYDFTETVGGAANISNGGVYVPVEGLTEAEAIATIQQRVVDDANMQTSWEYGFTMDDVRGGWF